MSEQILIIDSGMKNLGGHNFSYTRAVQSAFEQRGFAVTVFVNKQVAEDLVKATGYRPVFTFGAYDFPQGRGRVINLLRLYQQARVYRQELESALAPTATRDYSLIFCHTVNDFELIAWSDYVSRRALPGHLLMLLRHTPGFRACHPLKFSWHPYWRIKPHYLNTLYTRLGGRFTLLTDSELLTEDFACMYRHRIVTLPIPVSEQLLGVPVEPDSSPASPLACHNMKRAGGLCVGYMGDARGAKGFHLMPELVERVLAQTDESVRFVIQCPASASGTSNGQPAPDVLHLERVAQSAPTRVTLIAERLTERDYAQVFHHLDIVVLPYLARYYAHGTAGIFAEALTLAKPVVVPAGTWMAHELGKSGGGETFQSGDVVDLTAKVLQLIRHYDQYAAKAQRFSAAWRAFHNPHTVVELLLRESRLCATARHE